MRLSKLFTKTSKDVPAGEVAKNAQLLMRAGFVHKEMSGVYAFLPLGLAVLENIKQIVREEMDNIGGLEVQMTVLQPKDIFERTDRWDDKKVDNWFKTKLVSGTELGMGLTHEEPIVDMLSDYVDSYKDLPILVYQIQNKFRNELRAKSGLLRGREFVMKDMYSFARTQQEHETIYEEAAKAYKRVYTRLGIGDITYRTYADGGIFTEQFSDEFQMLSAVGEDIIFIDESKKIGVNKEVIDDKRLLAKGVDKNNLREVRAIEVGNIFPLESKYTDALGVFYTDKHGQEQSIIAGCYGIGVSRLVGAIAEHFADSKGLVWPSSIAPARVFLARLGSEPKVVKAADQLYAQLTTAGISVLYDDRDLRPGEKFTDADLIGLPHRVVVSEKTQAEKKFEIKQRLGEQLRLMSGSAIIEMLKSDSQKFDPTN